ncbi:MAG: hypothetical protein MHM6MM_004927, partial [Cercozoa sp. M6MM]
MSSIKGIDVVLRASDGCSIRVPSLFQPEILTRTEWRSSLFGLMWNSDQTLEVMEVPKRAPMPVLAAFVASVRRFVSNVAERHNVDANDNFGTDVGTAEPETEVKESATANTHDEQELLKPLELVLPQECIGSASVASWLEYVL